MTGNGSPNPQEPPQPRPPSGPRSADPLVRFLGPGATRNGPFGVLGLPPADLDDEAIVRAVHERMGAIDAHPESRTPAADEARLAVHAAAANLLDRGVRAALLERLGERGASSSAGAGKPSSTQATRSAAASAHRPDSSRSGTPFGAPTAGGVSIYQLEADLLRSIGAAGGWGPAARDRFIKLAHARGVDSRTAAASIATLTGGISQSSVAMPRGDAPPAARTTPTSSAQTASAQNAFARTGSRQATPAHAAPPSRIVGAGLGSPAVTQPRSRGEATSTLDSPSEQGRPASGIEADPRFAMPDDRSSGWTALTSVLVVSAILVVMVLAAGVTLLLVGGDDAPSELNEPSAPVVRAPRAAPTPEPADASEPTDRPTRRLDNAPAILHELEVATEGLAVDPEAAFAGFELAVDSLSARWGGFSVADRLAAQDLIIGFVYRVSGRGALLERAYDALAAGVIGDGENAEGSTDENSESGENAGDDRATPQEVWRAAWSMGTLVRLRAEDNLPSSLRRRIDGAIAPVFAGGAPNASTFRAGAIAVLRRLADPALGDSTLTKPATASGGDNSLRSAGLPDLRDAPRGVWEAWIGAVRAAAMGDDDLVSTMLLAAIDARLRGGLGGGPASGGSADAETLGALVAALDWSEGSAARAWLVRSFDDRSLGIDELHAVTLALATESAAGGVNHAMVLARGAGEYERRTMRDRYRELWGIAEDADRGETLSAFVSVARDAATREDDTETGLASLAATVRFARLNAAAAMLWRAEIDPAADLLASLDDPIDAVLDSAGGSGIADLLRPGGGTWAQEYLSAGSHIDKRLDLLSTAGAGRSLGPVEADVIVQEALRGSPLRVRESASQIVEAEAGTPTVVNAVLEALPLMPKTARNGAIVERVAGVPLPSIGDDGWDIEARRALVERLLELIAGRGEYARLDALSMLLDEAYAMRLRTRGGGPAGSPGTGPSQSGSQGSGSGSGSGGEPLPADASARELVSRWIAAAERRPPAPLPGLSIEDIGSRRVARLSSADGIVQVFHAHQLALAEVMTQVIAGEGSARSAVVRKMVETLGRERGRSRSVLRQIELTERFMLRLWLMRFEEEA